MYRWKYLDIMIIDNVSSHVSVIEVNVSMYEYIDSTIFKLIYSSFISAVSFLCMA